MIPGSGTSRGWFNPASRSISISVFGHTGALIAYTALIGFVLFQRAGLYQPGAFRRIVAQTARTASSPSLGIAIMVGIAMLMEQSGASFSLAIGLSRLLESMYPLLAPFIGLLGAFTTGSNLNSNVLFGGLQKETAQLLNLPVAVILAAQTAGGSLGSMVSPAKIILGCSTVGLSGKEGQIIRRTAIYVLMIAAVLGAITWLLAH
jgi:lactate permease